MQHRVAVVTGGNRGLGWEIVRQLAEKDICVVLAGRNREKGLMAAGEFERQELAVRYAELDVTSAASIQALGDFVEKTFGRCDILVNNAGIFPDVWEYSVDDPLGLHMPIDRARLAMETNAYAPLLLCELFIPLMKKNNYGRIVNMSSDLAQLTRLQDSSGKYLAYRMSKVALNMVTRVFAAETAGTNMLINSCTPGWCRTDMGGAGAPRTAGQGADTPVWLATLPDGGPTGGFFKDRQPIDW
ncbi:MAG: SDR family oxidoreductase [Candidatus Omnitrophica bacterium]|nr:SDR family oxidoreductase [Candidatus Omnitrophota bacterium]